MVKMTNSTRGFYQYTGVDWAKFITQDDFGSVAINQSGSNADASAFVDIQPDAGTNKGLLIPRLTSVQTAAIASPATSLMTYVTDGAKGFYQYTGVDWAKFITQDDFGNVAINQSSANADPSAFVHIQPDAGNNKGLLIPRLTSVQTASIASPATGLMTYVTDGAKGFYQYTGADWAKFITHDDNGNVAINQSSTNADASAFLDIQPDAGHNKGLLIPRLNQVQRDAIASPATSLMIYQTDAIPGFYYYSGTGWMPFVSSPATGTSLFIGQGAGAADDLTDNQNLFAGYNAGNTNTTGTANTIIGYNADLTGAALNNAAAIGANASVTASNNMVFGDGNVIGWGFGVAPGAAAIRVGSNGSNGNGATLTTGGVWTNASDSTKKHDIKNIHYGLSEVMKLRPVTYKMNGTNYQDIGFLAQEVKLVLPELVYGKQGEMSISYAQITSVLTKGMQEQQKMIEEQKKAIEELRKEIEALKKSK